MSPKHIPAALVSGEHPLPQCAEAVAGTAWEGAGGRGERGAETACLTEWEVGAGTLSPSGASIP